VAGVRHETAQLHEHAEQAEPSGRAAPLPRSGPERVLALQRTAGNQAVTAALGRRPAAPPVVAAPDPARVADALERHLARVAEDRRAAARAIAEADQPDDSEAVELERNGGGSGSGATTAPTGGGSGSGGGSGAPPAAPHPTAIAGTTVASTPLNFGGRYTHTMTSSTGNVADLRGVVVGEHVTVAHDDFGLGWGGVPLGTITAALNSAGRMDDRIGTPASAIRPLVPSLSTFPAVLDTPQTLHWRDASGSWNQFASVAITFTVRRKAAAGGGSGSGSGSAAPAGFEAVTVDNGVPKVENV
jgi:uncharacterized membrane protein YgcG